MNKKGFTLLEIIISIAVASIMFLSILFILNSMNRYQNKKEESWKAYKILENIHSMYLNNDNSPFLEGENILYFDKTLEIVDEDNAQFTVIYTLDIINDNTVNLYINRIYTKRFILINNYDLGKWVKS